MEDQTARRTLTDDELDAVLRTVSLPAWTEAYWRDFPTRIRGRLKPIADQHPLLAQGDEGAAGKAE